MLRNSPAAIVLMAAVLSGCSALPGETPMASDVSAQAADNRFELITVDPFVVDTAKRAMKPDLMAVFGSDRRAAAPRLDVGDTVQVTIWESLDSGLYTNATGRNTTLENLVIDRSGSVFVPYAGRLHIAGKTVEEARSLLQTRLEKETLRPQVELRLVSDRGYRIAVTGTVQKPGLYQLDLADGSGSLMEMLANAGGAATPAHRTEVTVVRGGRTGQINLEALYRDPAYDLALRPGDKIVLADAPRTFAMLGAVEEKGDYEFSKSDFRLMDALSAAGGLKDARAQRTGVFLLRFEDPSVVNAIRAHRGLARLETDAPVPTVYQLSLLDTRGFFYAKGFAMRDEDVVFVTNAPIHEWNKIIKPLSQGIFLARTGMSF